MASNSAKPTPAQRKVRTREHGLAELSTNHVERRVLDCAFAAERVRQDYGIDLILFFYDSAGEVRNGQAYLQLEATDRLKIISGGKFVSFPVDVRDLRSWLDVVPPVFLIVYDGAADCAYWLYVQAYFEAKAGFSLATAPESVTVRIPVANVVTADAVRQFERYNDDVVKQQAGKVVHHG